MNFFTILTIFSFYFYFFYTNLNIFYVLDMYVYLSFCKMTKKILIAFY